MKEVDPNNPVNKTAALVVSKSNHQGFDFKSGDKITSMTPLPTRQFTGTKDHDLTGKKFGRFIVVGCSLWKPKGAFGGSSTTRWVCKCKCGRYQLFTSKAVKRKQPRINDGIEYKISCVECEKSIFLGRKNWSVIDILNS